MEEKWYSESTDDVLSNLQVKRTGLNDKEVVQRRGKYGENKLSEPIRVPGWKRFLSQYNDPLNYLLIGAAIVALLIHPDQPGDAIFIFMVLTAHAYFGYWQEGQAEQAMESLKQMSVSQCVVVRNDSDIEIPTVELVPGDVVNLYEGLNVPADIRILESYQCKIDESALTGESLTIGKNPDVLDKDTLLADRKNMAYMGTCVASGRAIGVVVATGMNTQLGKIASDIAGSDTPKTPLELKLESLGKFLGFIALIVAVLLVSIEMIIAFETLRLTFGKLQSINSLSPLQSLLPLYPKAYLLYW